MKKKILKFTAIILVFAVSMTMSACATSDTIPISKEDNKEEYDQVTTYAAELLMKYSYNIVDNLTYVAIKNSEKAADSETESQATTNAFAGMAIDTGDSSQKSATTEDTAQTEPEISETEIKTDTTDAGTDITNEVSGSEDSGSEIANESSSLQTDTSGESSGGSETDTSETEDDSQDTAKTQETVVAEDDLSDLNSELGGLKLTFNGYSVMNAYPSMNNQGAVTAKDGEKVLVLNFVLSNPTSSAISLNVLNQNTTFKVSVNGSNVGYTKVTMLENDLSSYVGTVAAGSEEQLVLLVIIPSSQASSISDITVTISVNGNSYNVKLE